MSLGRALLLLVLVGVACAEPDAPPAAPAAPAAPGHPPGPPPANPPMPPSQGAVRSGAVDLDRPPVTDETGYRADAPCAGCDIVVITACSLRRDHVGAYGEIAGLTPAVDRIAAEAVRFDQAYSASNFTLASLAAILTGRFGSSTGVLGWGRGLPSGVSTLPEVLEKYGYRTGAFSIDAPSGLRPDYGLDRGFQRMVLIPPPRDTPDGRRAAGPIGPGAASARPAVEWIGEQSKERPIFALFHTRTAHFPFVIDDHGVADDPTGVTGALWGEGTNFLDDQAGRPGMVGGSNRSGVVTVASGSEMALTRKAGAAGEAVWRSTYRDAVARMDRDVAAVLDAIERRGRKDRTIVVVVADHGESLGDNGELLHGGTYFDNVVHVPLLVRVPGVTPGSRDALAGHVDLLPTLLELVGATAPAGIDGVSLVPVLRGAAAQARSVTFVEGGATSGSDGAVFGAVVAPPHVLLHQGFPCTSEFLKDEAPPPPPTPSAPGSPPPPPPPGAGPAERDCLFDLSTDPEQATNLAEQQPERVRAMLALWRGYRDAVAGRSVSRDVRLDPAFVELLQRTGYDFVPGAPAP